MKAYGYDRANEEAEAPMELKEVSLQCTTEQLDKMISFLNYVREHSVKHPVQYKEGECDHFHYRDWLKTWTKKESDFIILLVGDNGK